MQYAFPLVACSKCGEEYYAADGDRLGWTCERCLRALREPVRTVRQHCGIAMTYLKLPHYYDGALFLVCESCGGSAYPFERRHYLRARAEHAVNDGQLDWQLELAAQGRSRGSS